MCQWRSRTKWKRKERSLSLEAKEIKKDAEDGRSRSVPLEEKKNDEDGRRNVPFEEDASLEEKEEECVT